MKIYREVGTLKLITQCDKEGYVRPVYEIEVDEAEPVVRCKDCKYFQTYPPTDEQEYTIYDCERLSYCTDTAVSNQPNDYCSRGEKK